MVFLWYCYKNAVLGHGYQTSCGVVALYAAPSSGRDEDELWS